MPFKAPTSVVLAAALIFSPLALCTPIRTSHTSEDAPFDPTEDMPGGILGPILSPMTSLVPSLIPLQLNVTSLAELLSLALIPTPPSQTPDEEDPQAKAGGGQMADGTSMQTGSLKDGSGLKWQASGKLSKGCAGNVGGIGSCYTLRLGADPRTNLDPGGATPRQRIEFLTPGYGDGETATFTWKTYLDSSVITTNHFFHLMQLYSRGTNGPVLTMDVKNSLASILDPLRCSSDCGSGTSMDVGDYQGRTVAHAMRVTFGPNGRVDYVLGDAVTREVEMGYSAVGSVGSESTSLKFGTYRAAVDGMGASLAYVGDFNTL